MGTPYLIMGRPSTLNPLAIAFGGALQKLRQQRSISDVAKAAGLSATFLRLIESGRNHISVGKVPVLYLAFDNTLNYEGLVFVLSAIDALEDAAAKVTNPKTRGERLSEQAVTIATALGQDHPFNILLNKFLAPLQISVPKLLLPGGNIFHAVVLDADALRKLVADVQLDKETADFLAGYAGYGTGAHQIHQDYPEQFFKNIPTLYKEIFDGLKNSVIAFPPFFAPEVSWNWEQRNYTKLQGLIAFCSWKQLVDVRNLTRYKFDYLWQKNFASAVFVLLDVNSTTTSPDCLRKEFWTNLTEALGKRADEQNANSKNKQVAHKLLSDYNADKETLQNKTNFCPCPNDAANRVIQQLFTRMGTEDHAINALWFFRTTDKAFIGAASHIDPKSVKATHITFLTFSECSTALATLNNLFPGLL